MTVWKDVRVNRMLWLVVATLALGSLIGAGAGLLTLLLYGVEHVMLGYVEGAGAPGPFAVPAVRRAVSVTVGLSLAGLAWWLLRTKTTKVPSVKKAVAGERMPWWQTVVHVVLQIFIVGSGASIGREVAPRELGAMLAQRFCDLFHIGREGDAAGLADRRMVVAVAAGAGLGGVYDAPLAGMFFAVEILLADVTLEKVGFALGMSATAAYVASLVKGRHTFYAVAGMTADYTPSLMLFALLCGVACGAAGALFRKGSSWATVHQPKGAMLLWQMPLAGLVTGLVAVFAPQVMGNGRAAAQLAFDGMAGSAGTVGSAQVWSLVGLLAVTFLVKAATTLATIRSGASGGVLQPGIALGATLGATLGILWSFAFPGDPVGVCALIGAAALLSASQQAPLMAMCLVMELTEAPITLFVPVGLAVAVSAVLSHRLLNGFLRPRGKTSI
ncbi:chloride channel protein [Bifidobacterium sp. CP2]|uniref:chloride channel protein n=1 Tax=Bifidobacterium sp. CP2 TaxID=2809025 RepID=UPI001BDCDC90|nr:chloride channel protein [Bifidobacterium sp. CP2]MBT1181866.1 chloride channel protein [Bifidobacterium sp. CP2]